MPLADRLRASGHTVIVAPLLRIEPVPHDPVPDGIVALVFTSPRAPALLQCPPNGRNLPVFAIGAATAAAARAAGFAGIAGDGAGQRDRLAAAVAAFTRGPVLVAQGRDVAGDLPAELAALGVATEVRTVYDAVPVGSLSAEALDALADPAACLPLWSARSAALLARAVAGMRVSARIVCISAAAARPVAHLAPAIATVPSTTGVLAAAGLLCDDGAVPAEPGPSG